MPTDAQIDIDVMGGDVMQYTISPYDGSEPMSFILHPDGSFMVLDASNPDNPYVRVPGTDMEGQDLVDAPVFYEEGVYYDPEGNVTIKVGENAEGLTQIDIYPPGQGDAVIRVVPEKDEGTISRDVQPDDPAAAGQSYGIRPLIVS